MDKKFKERIEVQIRNGDLKLSADLDRAVADAAAKPMKKRLKLALELEMYAQLFRVLYDAWETGAVYTQKALADLCPLVKEGRPPSAKNEDKFKHIVRNAIEELRSVYGYPILSRPNFSSKEYEIPPNKEAEVAAAKAAKEGVIGYWLSRSEAEVVAYLERTEHEAVVTARTRLTNKLIERQNFGYTDNPFEEDIKVLNAHITRLIFARKGGQPGEVPEDRIIPFARVVNGE